MPSFFSMFGMKKTSKRRIKKTKSKSNKKTIKKPEKQNKMKTSYSESELNKKSLDYLKSIAKIYNVPLSIKGKAKNKKVLIDDILSLSK